MNPNTAISNFQFNRTGLSENIAANSVSVFNSNQIFSVVPSQNAILRPMLPENSNAIVLNYNSRAVTTTAGCYIPVQLNLPVNVLQMQMPLPSLQVLDQSISTSLTIPTSSPYQQTASHLQGQKKPQNGPIKVVDMNKLLQHPRIEDPKPILGAPAKERDCGALKNRANISSRSFVNDKEQTQTKNTSFDMKNLLTSPNQVNSKVTISEVLDCLKVILPMKFDLSRLKPSDKIVALVIRYLKLDDDNMTKRTVLMYLKIIVDASKIKEKKFGCDAPHPYWKINEVALQLALEKVFSPSCSTNITSHQLLNCLCIVLNQEVYVDGYHILRKLIRKFENEDQRLNEIINESINKNLPNEKKAHVENGCEQIKFSSGKVSKRSKRLKPTARKHKARIIPEAKVTPNVPASSNKVIKRGTRTRSTANESTSFSFESELVITDVVTCDESFVKSEIEESDEEFLEDNKDEIPPYENFSKSPKKPKKKVAKKAKVEVEDEEWMPVLTAKKEFCWKNNNNKEGPELGGPETYKAINSFLEKQQCSARDVLVSFRLMFYLCRFLNIRSKQSHLQQLKECLHLISKNVNIYLKLSSTNLENREDKARKGSKLFTGKTQFNKLKIKPVVVLRNLIDFELKDMLFMKDKKKDQSSSCNQSASLNLTLESYSSAYVEKLTSKSYKTFRSVIVKKVGKKVVFRLKYSKLAPGSIVFVKDFKNPSSGWLMGMVNKVENSLKYVVQLGTGEVWSCAPEQLRPLETQKPDVSSSPRTQRIVKPRQLFDL